MTKPDTWMITYQEGGRLEFTHKIGRARKDVLRLRKDLQVEWRPPKEEPIYGGLELLAANSVPWALFLMQVEGFATGVRTPQTEVVAFLRSAEWPEWLLQNLPEAAENSKELKRLKEHDRSFDLDADHVANLWNDRRRRSFHGFNYSVGDFDVLRREGNERARAFASIALLELAHTNPFLARQVIVRGENPELPRVEILRNMVFPPEKWAEGLLRKVAKDSFGRGEDLRKILADETLVKWLRHCDRIDGTKLDFVLHLCSSKKNFQPDTGRYDVAPHLDHRVIEDPQAMDILVGVEEAVRMWHKTRQQACALRELKTSGDWIPEIPEIPDLLTTEQAPRIFRTLKQVEDFQEACMQASAAMHQQVMAMLAQGQSVNQEVAIALSKLFSIRVKGSRILKPVFPAGEPGIVRLKSEELEAEGAEMMHCVASYARYVSLGTCAIYRILEDKAGKINRATAEIRPDSFKGNNAYRINQLYGIGNAEVSSETWEKVEKWLARQTGMAP